ncbi:uncharacterized protein LOC129950523 [Eupeodes corollae]|uniref:uncharacterized protein LOC129950523 n=1 Tax=Eupeodes corollae TaxID=290404 RepID=UPI002491F0B7|nr:uncharacterized protein LOC129950523 [Eupeodes corollae]
MSSPVRKSQRKNKGCLPSRLRDHEITKKPTPKVQKRSSSLITCLGFSDAKDSTKNPSGDVNAAAKGRPSTSQGLIQNHTNAIGLYDKQAYADEDGDRQLQSLIHTPHFRDMEVYNKRRTPRETTTKKRTTCFSMNDMDTVRERRHLDLESDFQRIDNWRKSTMFQEDKQSFDSGSRIFELENKIKNLTDKLNKATMRNNLPTRNYIQEVPESHEDESRPSYLDLMTTFMARQSKMDLPKFDGHNPEEWPLFKNEYFRTTKIGKFTSGENVTRLRTALKDKALETVSSLLILPNSAEKVMSILERKYGRPDVIIKSLIAKTTYIDSPKEDNPSSIVNFATAVENLTVMIELLDRPEYLANPQLIEELERKLPPMLHILWSDSIYDLQRYNLRDFSNWLDRKSQAASLRVFADKLPATGAKLRRRTGRVNTVTLKKDDEAKCIICSSNCKNVPSCKKFQEMTIDNRWKSVTKAGLCFSCLKKNHSTFDCREKTQCKVSNCKRYHNSLLHSDRRAPSNDAIIRNPVELCANSYSTDISTKLRILPIYIQHNDVSVRTLAILDPGATLTLIRSDIAELLKVKGVSSPLSIKWYNGDLAEEADSICFSTMIQGTHKGSKSYHLRDVRTVKKLPLVHQSINRDSLVKKWPYLQNIDFESYSGQPTVLIGENNALLTSTRQLIHDKWNSPIASKTWLGWTISGNDGSIRHPMNQIFNVNFAAKPEEEELHDLVKSFWVLDSVPIANDDSKISREDQRALLILENTTRRTSENRWESGLLWKQDDVMLPKGSKTMAYKRLLSLERRLDKDEILKSAYKNIIVDYLEKGYLRELPIPDHRRGQYFYLPHFPVLNANKPGKVRIVFDAAAKCNGTALNDVLLQGPDLLKSLPGVLLRFRQGSIGFVADIREMFHRVRVREEDSCSQLILWRGDDREADPKTYEMTAMTFGATCSPCTAIFVKDRNAEHFIDEHPDAVKAIQNHHYMDDYLGTARNIHEASSLINTIIKIHSHGGFELRNWYSSSSTILKFIPSHLLPARPNRQIEFNNKVQSSRVLGITWDTEKDVFTFTTNFCKIDPNLLIATRMPTKRECLQIIMSVFDPLGFIAHFVVVGKMLLQKIWKTATDWDDELPDELHNLWKDWLNDLQNISMVQIPRCYSDMFLDAEHVELHCFVDASEEAYSAVAYVRNSNKNLINISFIAAKAKVRPLKPNMTIPRLELQAAVLGSRLVSHIKKEHERKFTRTVLWTDSATVWYWIQSEARRYKQFVANRLSEISELTNVKDWRWLPTKLNVADDATRSGLKEFHPDSRWFRGPEFLYGNETTWPINKLLPPSAADELEFIGIVSQKSSIPQYELPDVTRFSNWSRLIRATAWMLRYVRNCNRRRPRLQGELTVEEVLDAEILWIRQSQRKTFGKEYGRLLANQKLDRTSKLYLLSPSISNNGTIVLDGRLRNLDERESCYKFPFILHGHDTYTRLLVRYYHVRANHIGHESVLNELHQKYWIVKVRPTLKYVKKKCNKCKLLNSKPRTTLMGQLPSARVTAGMPPFCFTGIDYFGPIMVKVGRRHEKRYGVLFTCLTIRAIHLEIATNLSTDAFIMALRRFVSRRGCPREVFSDNGTNFRGADKELRVSLCKLNQDKIKTFMTTHHIKWNFIPPASPHMGGCWERLVRSVKTTLKIILKEYFPTDELLYTLMTEIEGIINSRPLVDVPTDPDEPEALTPNHFLLGRSSASAPIGVFDKNDLLLRKHWRASQHLADSFWRRWRQEYLPTLNRRTKWLQKGEGVKVGDMVFIVDSNSVRGSWPKGVVTQVFPGEDGVVRVVEVRTASGTYRRPIAKLCVFNFDQNGIEDTPDSNTAGEDVGENSSNPHYDGLCGRGKEETN